MQFSPFHSEFEAPQIFLSQLCLQPTPPLPHRHVPNPVCSPQPPRTGMCGSPSQGAPFPLVRLTYMMGQGRVLLRGHHSLLGALPLFPAALNTALVND